MISSLKHNLTYYLSIAAAGVVGIGLLLISGRLHASDLLPLAMLLSNTYGGPLPPVLSKAGQCYSTRRLQAGIEVTGVELRGVS